MTATVPSRPEFFVTPEALGAWFESNADATELWLGFWKKGFERPGISYAEAVDEALCHGWIDSVLRRIDEASYMVRFTPRRPKSNWTETNLHRAADLRAAGRMRPGGERAIAAARAAAKPPAR